MVVSVSRMQLCQFRIKAAACLETYHYESDSSHKARLHEDSFLPGETDNSTTLVGDLC